MCRLSAEVPAHSARHAFGHAEGVADGSPYAESLLQVPVEGVETLCPMRQCAFAHHRLVAGAFGVVELPGCRAGVGLGLDGRVRDARVVEDGANGGGLVGTSPQQGLGVAEVGLRHQRPADGVDVSEVCLGDDSVEPARGGVVGVRGVVMTTQPVQQVVPGARRITSRLQPLGQCVRVAEGRGDGVLQLGATPGEEGASFGELRVLGVELDAACACGLRCGVELAQPGRERLGALR